MPASTMALGWSYGPDGRIIGWLVLSNSQQGGEYSQGSQPEHLVTWRGGWVSSYLAIGGCEEHETVVDTWHTSIANF